MRFHIAVNDLPWLRDYAAAKRRHDRTAPIRGRSPDLRPLGKRYAYSKTIVERVEDGVSYIACCLFGHELVKFFADGRIKLSSCGYATMSTAVFMRKVVYHAADCRVMGGNLELTLFRDRLNAIGRASFIVDEEGLTIMPDGTVVATPCVIHTLDKVKMRELRKQYKPFINYVVAMYKLTGTNVEVNIDQVNLLSKTSGLNSVLHNDDLELWMAWAARIIWQSITWAVPSSLRAVKNEITHNIKLAHPELFTRVELPMGEVKKDVNHKYVLAALRRNQA